ncbi:MAG: hypothetical protein AAFZ10_04975 [Pseudomonadota bacterium]
MRIKRFLSSERGAMSIEAVLVVPILVACVLMARVVAESFLLRADAASDARQAVVSMADTKICWPAQSDYVARQDMSRSGFTSCWTEDAERITRQEPKFQDAIRRASRQASFLYRDVIPDMRADTALARSRGTSSFTTPNVLRQRDTVNTQQTRSWPSYDTWEERDQPWRDGLDKAIYQQIERLGDAERLFPRVFPAARR